MSDSTIISSSFSMRTVNLKGTAPCSRANTCTSISSEESLFLTGGNNATNEFSDMFVLDTVGLKWSQLPDRKEMHSLVGASGYSITSGNTNKEGVILYGGWSKDHYNDSLFLYEFGAQTLHECPRTNKPSKKFGKKINKTMNNMKDEIDFQRNLPNARRDHTFSMVGAWSMGVMVGGWNSLEWNPSQRLLEVWSLTPGNFSAYFRVEMGTNGSRGGEWPPSIQKRPFCSLPPQQQYPHSFRGDIWLLQVPQ